MPAKSSRWYGSSLASAALRASTLSARIISRIASMRSPSKNMCSVRVRPMPDGAERHRVGRLLGRVGIGAHVHCAYASEHHFISCWKFLNFSVFLAASFPSISPATISRGRRLHLAGVDFPGRAVDRDPVAFLERLPFDLHRARLVVDLLSRRRRTRTPCPSDARPTRRATIRHRAP